jgi:hypothetical protein
MTVDKAFAAAFSDDSSKVEEITQAAQEARVATDDKPEQVETPVEEAAEPSSAKEPEVKPADKPADTEIQRPKTVPHEALHAERKRREAVEAELAELKKKPPTSFLDDEDKAFNERLAPAVAELKGRLFNQSVNFAKRMPGREDYQEVYDFMAAEVEKNPALFSEIDADDPGESIYQLGKVRKELADVGGDITKLREHAVKQVSEKLTAAEQRIKALEAELAGKKQSEVRKALIPQSLNAENSASQNDEVFKGPTPLKDIFPKI